MVSPNSGNPSRYHRIDKFVVPSVIVGRDPTSSDIKDPKTGKYYERPHFWLVGPNPSTGTQGDLWYLADISANAANWKQIASSSTPGGNVISLTPDDATEVFSDAAGDIDLQGKVVANATRSKPLWNEGTPGSNLIEFEIQVGTAITGAPSDKNDAGLISANDTQFTVNSDGYMALVGGTDLPALQTLTSDDPTTVGPDGSGDITVTGEAVANAINAKPLFVDAGTNNLNVEVQVGAAVTGAPADKNDAGIISANDTQFTIDSNGYLELVGSTDVSPFLFQWVEETGTSRSLNANEGVIGNNASQITMTLPASASLGDVFRFVQKGAGTIQIAQNAGQQIHVNGSDTSSGASGTLTSNAQWDAIELVCVTANTDFVALSQIGTWVTA